MTYVCAICDCMLKCMVHGAGILRALQPQIVGQLTVNVVCLTISFCRVYETQDNTVW